MNLSFSLPAKGINIIRRQFPSSLNRLADSRLAHAQHLSHLGTDWTTLQHRPVTYQASGLYPLRLLCGFYHLFHIHADQFARSGYDLLKVIPQLLKLLPLLE